MRLIVEGWRNHPHSYGVVSQFLALALREQAGAELFFRDLPFVFPGVKPRLGDPEIERRLAQIPKAQPDQLADATIRFIAPASLTLARTGKTIVFCTAEFGIVQPAMLDGSLAALNATPNLALMTPSDFSRSGLIRGGADPDKVITIPHGFDPAIFHPVDAATRERLRAEFGWGDDFVFLNAGALTANKGIFELLKAFAVVLHEVPRARLVLKGLDSIYNSSQLLDEYKRALTDDERKRVESRVTYIGKTLTYVQTAALYQSADAYAAPYKAEGFNLPVLEAAACGLPVICTAGGPTDEFTDPSFCLRIPSVLTSTIIDGIPRAKMLEPDQAELAATLIRVAKDPALAKSLGDAGPPFVLSRFTWKHAADQLLRILRDPYAPCWRSRPTALIAVTAPELDPEAIYRLGVAALEANKADDALRQFHHAALLRPENAAYISAMGEAYRMLGRARAAADAFRAAIELDASAANAHNALGEVLLDGGDAAASLASFRAAISARPNYARAHMNLGRALNVLNRFDEASASLKEAIRLDPKYTIAHNNLGAVLQAQRKNAEAATCFRAAIALRPDYPEAHFNLGSALRAAGDLAGAGAKLQEAIRLRPNYARAYAQLAQTVFDAGQVAASVQIFQRAISLNPKDNASRLQLGAALRLLGRLAEAQPVFDQALQVEPDSTEAFVHRFRLRQEVCDWTNYAANVDRVRTDLRRELQTGKPTSLHPLHAMALPFSGAELLEIAQSHGHAYEEAAVQRSAVAPAAIARSGRLKIAYLSRDFYDHPVGHLIRPLFGLHDREKFEVHAYSFGPNDASSYRQQIEADCEHFHDVTSLSVAELDQKIRADGIHILVDLMGYTGMARTACLALRPAPIQVSWLGYAGTMGASFIDYIIADAAVAPPGCEANFSEQIVQLPGSFMIVDNQQAISESRPARREHALPDAVIVFCCFNNAHKIEPGIFDVWMAILRDVPRSVTWLSIRDAVAQANLQREAKSRGVDPARLIFARHVQSKVDHLARIALADLFLDTHFYNAHATSADALCAGVPVLTCPGDTFASRVAASVVSAAGLQELVMADLQTYQSEAIRLAKSPAELQLLRNRLEIARTTAPLFDTRGFVRNLERAFEAMGRGK